MTITFHGELTAERVRDCLSYCPENGVFVWVKPPKEHKRLAGTVAGCVSTGYVMIKFDGIGYKAHRLAWLYVYGSMPEVGVDHKDGNPLNNRLGNLRLATQSQNGANAARKAGKATPKGVRRLPSGRYQARIRHAEKLRTIGTFNSPEAAAQAYISESKRLNGEFARAA